jgi:NAD-dependent DNA ligase
MVRNEVVQKILENGGNYASTVTRAVTHIIVADPDDSTAKIEKARERGVKIVGVEFLSNL